MSKVYFKNEKTGKMFEVVGLDNAAGTITLKGEHAQFTEPYDKERFKQMGYTLVRQEAKDAVE